MVKTKLVEEFHLTIRVPVTLSADQTAAIRRAINGKDFMRRLRQALRAACRVTPSLAVARLALTR